MTAFTNDDDFATAVLDLYTRIRRGIPEESDTKIPDDVAAVAFPLATLRDALDSLRERLVENPEPGKVKRSAYVPALNLFDALVSGAAHPFWRYAETMQKSIHHRRPPTEVETTRRASAVGLLRALMRAGGHSERRAAGMIETECLKRGMRLTVAQLQDWNTDFSTAHADDPEPDQVAQTLQTIDGKPSTNVAKILAKGVLTFNEFFGKTKR